MGDQAPDELRCSSMSHFRVGASVFVLLLLAGVARADAGLPGVKRLEVHVRFENIEDYSEHVFFFVAADWLTGKQFGPRRPEWPEQLSSGGAYHPGSSLRYYRHWVLVAVPRSAWAIEGQNGHRSWALLDAKRPGVLHSNIVSLPGFDDLLFSNPKEGELHRFRIDIENGRLIVSPLGVESWTSPEGWAGLTGVLFALLASASLAWVGLKWARRPGKLSAVGFALRVGTLYALLCVLVCLLFCLGFSFPVF
jgi:hypothetical protein